MNYAPIPTNLSDAAHSSASSLLLPNDASHDALLGGSFGQSAASDEFTREASGDLLSSCINISNTILGTGMLAIPMALADVGLLVGMTCIGLAACASAFGLWLLTQCAAQLNHRQTSFFTITMATLPRLAVAFDAAIAIKCFGVSISYLVVIGDLMPKVVLGVFPDAGTVLLSKVMWITMALVVIAPISFSKHLNALRFTSGIALLSVAYLLLVVVGYAAFPTERMPPKLGLGDITWIKLDGKLLTTLPIFVFAFTCHQNIFSVYNELADNSTQQVGKVIGYSLVHHKIYALKSSWPHSPYIKRLVLLVIYVLAAQWAPTLLQYAPSAIITGGQFAMAILVLFSYPLQCHPCRLSLEKVWTNGGAIVFSTTRYKIMTMCILFGSYIIAISVTDLSMVLSLVGATGSTMICYVLPGLLYYRMRGNSKEANAPRSKLELGAAALSLFGCVIMVICVGAQFISIFNSKTDRQIGHLYVY